MANKRGSIERKNPTSPWFNNVAKSLGYTTTDIVTKLTPSIGEFFKDNADYSRDVIRDIRELRTDSGRLNQAMADNATFKIAKEGFKNALDDIRTGKIYNKERQAQLVDQSSGLDLGDMGDDNEFGLIDFSLEDDDDSAIEIGEGKEKTVVAVPKVNVNVQAPSMSPNNPLVKAVDRQARVTVQTAQANMQVQQTIASNQMLISQKIGTATVSGIQTMNDNLTLLVNFQNDSMAKYIGASIKYYDEHLKATRESIDELKKMVRFQTESQTGPMKETANPADDLFLSGGGLNVQAYVKNITKNVKNNPFYDQVKEILSDDDTMKWIAASPLSFISTKLVTTMIPTFLQSSLEGINKSFENFFPAMLMRINRMADGDNIFLKIFGEIFGAKVYSKSSVDLSKFNRGAMSFDGETKKSIVEVIPGYLRKILAAVSNEEEMAFDMSTGKFEKVSRMKENFDKTRDRRILNEYMEAIDSIQDRTSAFKFKNPKEQEEFNKGIEQFFLNLSRKNSLVNPYRTKNRNGEEVDELMDVFNFNNAGMQKLLRQAILSMDKNEVTRIFGKDTLNAKAANNKFYDSAENNPSENNAGTIFNGLGYDQHLEKKNGKIVAKRGSIFNQVDKYNFTALDYLRDIKQTLLQGIRVYPKTGTNLDGGSDDPYLNLHKTELKAMNRQKANYINEQNRLERQNRGEVKVLNGSQTSRYRKDGITPIDDGYDIDELDDSTIQAMMKNRLMITKDNEKENKGVAQWVGKFFKGDSSDKMALVREKIDDMLQKPAQLLTSVFDKVDSTLHRLVFGKDGEDESSSFFGRMMASTNEYFKRMGNWMQTKVMNPIKESLVGENGIITKIKESEQFQNLKARGKQFAEYMFGKEGKDGKRRDGLLAQTGNNLLDMWDASKYYFTGNPYTNRQGQKFDRNEDSVFGQMRQMGVEFKDNVKHYLFGNKKSDDVDQQKGTLTGILEGLSTGFGNFRDAIFGPKGMTKNQTKLSFDELKNTVKNRMPKTLAWGGVGLGAGALGVGTGLLGSLFLPGGPIGMALVGSALGFASQSDRFNNWLFGEKDARGDRLGGVVSKKVQDFFSRNKATLIGGAAIGALNPVGSMIMPLLSFGLLPAMTMGPMFGAVTGMAAAMALRSNTMQKFLFGPKDLDGKRAGGIMSKMFKSTKEGKNLFANMGAGALGGAGLGTLIGQFGMLGFAFGPITGALTGAVAGIALSSDKWKKALFGEWDAESGLRNGGLLGKFQNFMQMEVIKPFTLEMSQIGLNMKKWFTQSIANPFTDAIAPMKQAFKNMTESLNKFFVDGWASFKDKIGETFENHVGKPFGMFMKENIMDPMKGFFTKLLGGIGRLLKPFAEAPVRLLSAFTSGLETRHKRRGIEKMRESEDKALKEQKDAGYKVKFTKTVDEDGNVVGDGYFGSLRRKYFNRKYIDEAQYNDAGASYASPEAKKRRKERNEKQNAEFDAKQAQLDEARGRLDKRRKLGLKYDYDNFTEDGRNISYIYRTTKRASRLKAAVGNDGANSKLANSIASVTGGVSLSEILGLGADAKVDPNSIGKTQNKLVQQAIKLATKQNLTGNDLRKYLKLGDYSDSAVAAKQKQEEAAAPMRPVIEAIENSSAREELKESIAPKIDITNTRLENVVETIKSSFGRLMADESGHIVMDNFMPGKKKQTKQQTQKQKAESVAKAKKESLFERAVTSIEKLVQKMNDSDKASANAPTESQSEVSGRTLPPVGSKLSNNDLLRRIAIYTRRTAQEVAGQLDGVGSNVYKTRRILQKLVGIDDSDLSGSSNRDRIGIFGRIRRMLFKPIEAITDRVNVMLDKAFSVVSHVATTVKNVGKAIVKIPVDIAKTGANLLKKGFTTTLKVIETTAFALADAFTGTVEVLKTSIVTGIKTVGKGIVAVMDTVHSMSKIVLNGVESVTKSIFKAGEKLVDGIVMGATGLIKGGWEFLKGAGEVAKGLFHATTSVLKEGLFSLGRVGKNVIEKVTDFSMMALSGFSNMVIEAGKTFWTVMTSPFKFITKKVGEWLGMGKQEVVITGGHLDSVGSIGVVEKLISMLPYPKKNERLSVDDIKRDADHEIKFGRSRQHESLDKQYTGSQKSNGPVVNVVVSGMDEHIYELMSDAISHAIHLEPIHVITENGGGFGPGGPNGSGFNGPSNGFNGRGGFNRRGSSGRGSMGRGSLRGMYNRFRNFRRNGGLSRSLGRMAGRFTNKFNQTRKAATALRNDGVRGSMVKFYSGLSKSYRAGFNSANSNSDSFSNGGDFNAGLSPVNAAHALNASMGGMQQVANALSASANLGGRIPTNLALHSLPVMMADQAHQFTSRRTAGYELEQMRIRKEAELLQNFRVTTMSHMENLDNNVYEILEILRNWKKGFEWPEFHLPPIAVPGIDDLIDKLNNCWDCDGKKKPPKPPTKTPVPPVVIIDEDDTGKTRKPISVGGVVGAAAAAAAIKAAQAAAKAAKAAKKAKGKSGRKAKPIGLPDTKDMPKEVPDIKKTPKHLPDVKPKFDPVKIPDVPPMKPKFDPVKIPDVPPMKPPIRVPTPKVDPKPDVKPSPFRRPFVDPDIQPDVKPSPFKPKVVPNPDEKPAEKPRRRRERRRVPQPKPDVAQLDELSARRSARDLAAQAWQEYSENARRVGFNPWANRGPSIFRKGGPVRQIFSNMGTDLRNVGFNLVDDAKTFGRSIVSGKRKFVDKLTTPPNWMSNGVDKVRNSRFMNSKTGSFLKGTGKVLGKIATPLAAGYGAFTGQKQAAQLLGLGEDEKATTKNKVAAGLAGALTAATPLGLIALSDKYTTEGIMKSTAKGMNDLIHDPMGTLKREFGWKNIKKTFKDSSDLSWGFKGDDRGLIGNAWKKYNVGGKFKLGAEYLGNGISSGASSAWNGIKGFFGGTKVSASGKDDGVPVLQRDANGNIIPGSNRLGKHEEDFTSKATKKAKDVWDKLSGKTTSAWETMSKGVTGTTDSLTKTTSEKWSSLKKGATKGWTDIRDKVTNKASELSKDTKDKWDKLKKNGSSGWKDINDKVTSNISSMWKDTKKKWDDNKKKTTSGWKDINDKITSRVSEMWKDTKKKWDDVKTKTVGGWKDIHSKVTGKVADIWKDTKTKWDDVKTKTTAGWKDIHSKVTGKVSEIWKNTKDTWDDVKSETSKKWDEMKKEAPKAAKDIYDNTLGMLGSVKDNVVSFGTTIGKKATGVFESIFGKGDGGSSKDHGGGIAKSLASYAGGALQQLSGWGGGPSKAEMRNGAVYFSQKDKRWAGESFGGANTMGDIGCAPTSAAMVVSTMTGKQVTPDQMAKDAVAGGYVNPQLGTHKSYFNSLGKYGVNMTEAGSKSPELMANLMQNKPVVLRGQGTSGSSPFTENGHFVVATGMNEKGQIMVNDPLSKSKSRAYDASSLLKHTTTSFVPSTPKGVETVGKSYGAGNVGAPITFNSGAMSAYGAGTGTQTSGPFKGHYVTSEYGSPRNATPPKYYHTGIDLQDPGNKNKKRPLKAFTNGKVIKVGNDPDGWGLYIIIEDENGYRHYYAHLSKINVKQGQSIKQGSIIGNQGNTGRVFGANGGYHLHYEIVKPGKFHGAGDTDVNPTSYLSKYKGKKGFVGELLSNFGTAASAVVGGATSLIMKAKDKVTGWFDKTFDTSELKQFKVLGQLTKAFGIHQFNLLNSNKMDWLLNEATEAPNADFSGTSGPVDYGMEVRKFNAKKLYSGKYQDILNEAAKRYNIEPQLIAAIIQQESRWNPTAGSPAGARGLMQLMPKTAAYLGVDDVTDPYQNIMGGTKYITQQLASYKSLKKALMAYNWGPGNAKKNNWDLSRAPKETRDYVGIIMRNLQSYRNQVGGGYGGGNKEENLPAIIANQAMSKVAPLTVTPTLKQGPSRLSSLAGAEAVLRTQSRKSSGESMMVTKVVALLQEIAENTGNTIESLDTLTKVVAEKETVVVVSDNGKKTSSKPKAKASHNTNPLLAAMQDIQPDKSAAQVAYQQAKRLANGR